MLAQLVEDLLHLERREDGLDQHAALDGALRHAQVILRLHEDVVPEARLEVALHLWQIEVRPGAAAELLLRVVEEEEAEVEDAGRHRLAIHQDVLLIQVPAARADQQCGDVVLQGVLLALGRLEGDGAAHGVAQVDLPEDRVVPGGGVGVLEVRHEHLGARVQRVDDHLAVHGARDLHAAVLQVVRQRGDLPRRVVADVLGLGQEVRALARLECALAGGTGREQLLAPVVELALEAGYERQRLRGEDLRHLGRDDLEDLDAFRKLLLGHWSSVTVFRECAPVRGRGRGTLPGARRPVPRGQKSMTTFRASPVRARRNPSSTCSNGTWWVTMPAARTRPSASIARASRMSAGPAE